jgi:acyl dehydratase
VSDGTALDHLGEWTTLVEAGPMQVFSLLTNDPNPIHWDRSETQRLGYGDRLINQGGLNVAYVLNAIQSQFGTNVMVSSATFRFLANAFEGDTVIAGGEMASSEGATSLMTWLRNQRGDSLVTGVVSVTTEPTAKELI